MLLKRAISENLHSVFPYPGCLPTGTQSSVLAHGMIYLKPCDEQRLSSGVSLQFFFISFIWSSKIMVSCFILSLWEKSHEISVSIFSVHWLVCDPVFLCHVLTEFFLLSSTTHHYSFILQFWNLVLVNLLTLVHIFFVPWILTIFLFLMATQVFLTVVLRTFLCKLFRFIGCSCIRI